MRDLLSSVLFACGVSALLIIPYTSLVQAETLYRVELLVFADPSGGASEQWEATPDLRYPERARSLVDLADQRNVAPPAGTPLPSADASVVPVSGAAFVLLPASERELGAGAAAMQGSGRYRVLFHQAWLQPISGRSAVVPIALDRSGEGGVWPELQGTIMLYKAGDYFLETNLWLNTQGEYLPGTWRMPPPPRGPRPGSTATPSMQFSATPDGQSALELSGEAPAGAAADYPYRHAVSLQQTRRMRVGEVYYIDHPMLGVAAKITPLVSPEIAPGAAPEQTPERAPETSPTGLPSATADRAPPSAPAP